jgi:hypothetical protein
LAALPRPVPDRFDQPVNIELVGLDRGLQAELFERLRRDRPDAGEADVGKLLAVVRPEQLGAR